MVLRRSSSHQQMALSHCIASWRQIGKFLCKYILVFRRLCAFINNDLNGAQTSLSCEKSIAVCYACWLYMLYVVQVKSAILLLTLSYHINLEYHSIAFLCWCAIKKLLPHSLTVTNTWYQWWCDNCSHCQCHYILWRLLHNHTLARYCESVVRATMQVSGETQNLNPTTPNPHMWVAGVIKICRDDYVMDPCAKVRHDLPRGFVSMHAWLCTPNCTPKGISLLGVLATCYSQGRWTAFDAKYAKTRFHARMCLFGVANIKSNI